MIILSITHARNNHFDNLITYVIIDDMYWTQLFMTLLFCWLGSQSSVMADKAIWSKPVVIGASVSDGYDLSEPIGGIKSEKLSLENYLEKFIVAPHGKFTNFGNKFFFMNSKGVSTKQVENAEKLKPSVVLAPDFLFWLVYGNLGNEEARMISLNRGLKLLEKFDCPMVIGNIPDASKAKYRMLAPSQIPKLETMAKANRRIDEWVSKRKNVIILDNKTFMKNSHANEEIKLKYNTIKKGDTTALLQSDFLHPTASGARAISLALLESLHAHIKFPKSDVSWKLN